MRDRREYFKKYRKEHREELNARAREWRKKNPEKQYVAHKRWVEENKEHMKDYFEKYKAVRIEREKAKIFG